MIALLKNIKGARRVVFESLLVIITVISGYLITYSITHNIVTAAIAAAFATFVAFAAIAAAFATFAAFVAFAAAVAAEEYKIKYWKVLIIFMGEALLLLGAMILFVPYLAIGVLAVSCITIVSLLAESGLRLWLKDNEPPQPVFEEKREKTDCGVYRAADVIVSRSLLPESFRLRLHRRLYNLYIN